MSRRLLSAKASHAISLIDMPDLVMVHIISYLGRKERLTLGCTCSVMRDTVEALSLWRNILISVSIDDYPKEKILAKKLRERKIERLHVEYMTRENWLCEFLTSLPCYIQELHINCVYLPRLSEATANTDVQLRALTVFDMNLGDKPYRSEFTLLSQMTFLQKLDLHTCATNEAFPVHYSLLEGLATLKELTSLSISFDIVNKITNIWRLSLLNEIYDIRLIARSLNILIAQLLNLQSLKIYGCPGLEKTPQLFCENTELGSNCSENNFQVRPFQSLEEILLNDFINCNESRMYDSLLVDNLPVLHNVTSVELGLWESFFTEQPIFFKQCPHLSKLTLNIKNVLHREYTSTGSGAIQVRNNYLTSIVNSLPKKLNELCLNWVYPSYFKNGHISAKLLLTRVAQMSVSKLVLNNIALCLDDLHLAASGLLPTLTHFEYSLLDGLPAQEAVNILDKSKTLRYHYARMMTPQHI